MADPPINDPVVWVALRELSGTDLKTSSVDYLHDETSFREWLD
ncbi:hypothetical protein [Aeromicrobium sp. CF3.5]